MISAAARDKLATIQRYYETPQTESNHPTVAKDVEWLVKLIYQLDEAFDEITKDLEALADRAERAGR